MRRALALAVLLLGGLGPAEASSPSATLVGAALPTFEGVRWAGNAPRGAIAPADYAGRVLVVTFFRSDDPDALAAFAETAKTYEKEPEVAFLAIQWLGWAVEPVGTAEEGRALVSRRGLSIPWGTLLGTRAEAWQVPAFRYAASQIPWTTVVDRRGTVRFEGRERDAARLRLEVESLRAVRGTVNPLVGQPFGPTDALRGLAPAAAPGTAAPRLTLYRWWTNHCPHCTDSVPALARLEDRHRARGFRLVAVYHPKGVRLSDAQAKEYARRLGFSGALAFDDRWAKYLELQRRGDLRTATSVSLLVDAEGRVLWVHPGPRLQETGDPRVSGAEDLAALDRLLDRALPPAAPPR